MSHFAVIVVTPERPTEAALAAILQPWHEFECTWIDDRYVQDIDITADLRTRYEADTRTMLTAPDGTHHSPYDAAFFCDPTPAEAETIGQSEGSFLRNIGFSYETRDWGDGLGRRAKVRFVPDGYIKAEVACLHLMTFREFVAQETSVHYEVPFGAEPDRAGPHKYGMTRLDAEGGVVQVIDRTNPNKKWDWWRVGGRWTGLFKLKAGAAAHLGAPGLMTSPAGPGRGDQAPIGDIDFTGMRDEAGGKAAAQWDAFRAIVGLDATWRSWTEVRESLPGRIDEARVAYWAQDALMRLKESDRAHRFDFETDSFLQPRDVFVRRARDGAIATHALVKDGAWFERGRMGWWAVVHDEKDDGAWEREFAALLDGLPPTTWLTAVDCHI